MLNFYQVKEAGSNTPILDSPSEKIHRWKEVNHLVNTNIRASKRFTSALVDAVLRKWYGEDAVKFFDKPIERHDDKYFSGSIKKDVGENIDDILSDFVKWYYENVYKPFVIDGFNISAERFMSEMSQQNFNATQINFNEQNFYVRSMESRGLDVLSDIIFKQNQETIRVSLADSAFRNLSVPQMRKELENLIGKGTQWKYNRLIRSEVALAIDNATVAESRLNGINYVQWLTALNPCKVCRQYRSKIWKTGENPRPVYSTHPHCFCLIRPKLRLKPNETVQPKFDVPEEMRYAA